MLNDSNVKMLPLVTVDRLDRRKLDEVSLLKLKLSCAVIANDKELYAEAV